MAIDTRQKRFSMLNMASGLDGAGIHTLFEADGAVDQDDRQSLLDCYSGIAFASPTIPTALTIKHEGLLRNVGRFMGSMLLLAVVGEVVG